MRRSSSTALAVACLASAIGVLLPGTAVAASEDLESFRPRGITAADAPVAAARAAVRQRPGLFDAVDPAQLVVVDRSDALSDITVVRLEQRIDGVPVLGGEAVVAMDEANRVVAASGEALAGPGPDTSARITAEAARSIALREVASVFGAGLTATRPELVIFDPTLFGGPGFPGGTLVWDLVVEREPDVGRRILVNADTGAIVLDIEAHRAAKQRQVCDGGGTQADTSGLIPCDAPDAVRVEGDPDTGTAEVDRVYEDLGSTYDFFADLGRDSIDNAGLTLRATVRACPSSTCPYANAYWSSQDGGYMVFGEGFGYALDVTAHELTHGVTDSESELFYWYQSGAINESLSDIFGELVELSANPGSAADRWLMGEDLPIGAIRDMENPNAFYDPASTDDPLYYAGTGDNGGVHINSGVGNRAASLLADGGTFNGQTVTGIGLAKSARIWYQAARLLRSGSDYADLAVALTDGCQSLVGYDAITGDDCTQVGYAIMATRMAVPPPSAPVPQAPVCTSGVLSTAYATSFESGFDGWTTPSSGNRWYDTQDATDWWRMAASGRHNVWAWDAAAAGADSSLTGPAVAIPAGAYHRLSHAFGLDAGEGAVIEYSTNNGGTWSDIAGVGAVDEGYNGTVSTGTGALLGRSAFIGTSEGVTSTRVDLAALAGQTVRFRFRFVTVAGNQSQGWFIDDVAVYTCPGSVTATDTSVTVTRTGGPANGTVLMIPSGQTAGTGDVSCRYGDASCTVPSTDGSFVTLQAVPDPNAAFAGWSGGCTGAETTCAVTADQARSVTATFSYTGPTPPTVVSFTRIGASPRVTGDVTFRITFDEAITGLTGADFSSVRTGTATCAIGSISTVSASVYDFRATACSGIGTYGLQLNTSTVADGEGTAGPAIAATSETVEFVAATPPGVTTFASAGATTTTSLRPVFQLDFDEAVTGVDANDFSLFMSLGLFCLVDSVTTGDQISYLVTLTCGGTGTVQLELAANGATDSLGALGPATAQQSGTITIEASAPPTTTDPPAQQPVTTPPTTDTPTTAPAPTVKAPVLSRRAVRWSKPTSRGVVASRFKATRGVTYRVSARQLSRRARAVTKRGRCRVRKGTAICSVRLLKGRWRIEITPVSKGVKGKPVRRTVRISAPRRR